MKINSQQGQVAGAVVSPRREAPGLVFPLHEQKKGKRMNSLRIYVSLGFAALALCVQAAQTSFTYQGRLSTGAAPANGQYEITFTLFDALTNGTATGSQTISPVPVTNGLFAVLLDFGSNAFTGAPRWLEVAVTVFGSDQPVTVLQPRQPVTATPYALHALNAANLMNSENAPLEIKVNGVRALRVEPAGPSGSAAANIIGGYAQNGVSNGVVGAFIGGGGLNDFSEGNRPNRVNASFSAIVGGYGNEVNDEESFIGGGFGNRVSAGAYLSTIGGGQLSRIESGSYGSFIGGGIYSGIESASPFSVVSGGYQNTVLSNSPNSTIGGGSWNFIGPSALGSTINGGISNRASGVTTTIGGGMQNTNRRALSTISGGWMNMVGPDANSASIGGGLGNYVNGDVATVAGGGNNVVTYDGGTIAGGAFNTVTGDSGTIGGGQHNTISGSAGTIGGGLYNSIFDSAVRSAIGGGSDNSVGEDSPNATIAGGMQNLVGTFAPRGTVGGGGGNSVYAQEATIAGGSQNEVHAVVGTIGGGGYNAILTDAGHAVVGGGLDNVVSTNSGFSTISGGRGNLVANNALWAAIPGGAGARASSHGQLAFSSGGFDQHFVSDPGTLGSAQASLFVLKRTTTNATPTELFLDGDGSDGASGPAAVPSARMTVPNGGRWSFEGLIVASATNGTTAGYRITGVVKNVDGSTSLVGVPNVTPLGVDPAAASWNPAIEADNAHSALVLKAAGSATRIRWVATVRTCELVH